MNKKKYLIIIGIVGVLLIGLGIYFFLDKSVATVDSTILKNQIVDGLTFEDADLKYEDGISTFTVNVTNDNKETYSLNYIEIKLTAPDDEVITLIGYIGEEIDKDKTQTIIASIDRDITDSKSLEYVINK